MSVPFKRLDYSIWCMSDHGLQKTFEFKSSIMQITKSQHKFFRSTEGVYSTLVKRWSNGLFGWFDVRQQVSPTSHTCVCSCCCKHLGRTKWEGPMGIPLVLSLSLSFWACVQGKMNGISGMRPQPKSLTSAVWSLAWHSCGDSSIIKELVGGSERGNFYTEQRIMNTQGLWNISD